MTRGMLTIEELATKVRSSDIDTVVVGFTDHYGRVHGKRFDAAYFLEEVVESGTHGCDYLLTVDMEMEPVPGYRYANWELGYGDFHMVPDPSTLREATWLDRTAMVLSDLHDPHHHDAGSGGASFDPSSQLERAGESGLRRQGRIRARVLPLRGQLPECGREQVPGPDARPAGTSRTITCCREPGRRSSTGRCGATSRLRGYRWRTPKGNGDGASTR